MKLCDYGCSQEANFKLPNGKVCCSDKHTKCPAFQSKVTYAKKIKTSNLCNYGCKQQAKYIFPVSKKFCCSERLQSCPAVRERNSKTNKIKQSGSGNAIFGKKHTEESIEKLWDDPNSFLIRMNGTSYAF